MKKLALTSISIILICSGCYKSLELDGFEKTKWLEYETNCSDYRVEIADHLIKNQDVLLRSNQNEIKNLLGVADEHELYERNQKFFHYRLTPPDSCEKHKVLTYLSIRFNAMGRANSLQVIHRDASRK